MWLNRYMDVTTAAEEIATLKAQLAQTQAALAASEEARRRLETIVSELRREKFGSKSEKLSPEQYNLPLEDVEIAQGVLDAAQEKAETVIKGKSDGQTHPRRRNRGRLPAHLPRVERVIEPESRMCPCGCGEMAKIGEDVSERLDMIPAQFRVLVTRRPKYACRRCSRAVVQAHAPEHVVPGGLPTERLIAQVIVSKQLGRPGLLPSPADRRAPRRTPGRGGSPVHGRDHRAGARSRTAANEEGLLLGHRSRRSRTFGGWPADRPVPLCARARWRPCRTVPARLSRAVPAMRRLRRL
jgi:hypothetical protein